MVRIGTMELREKVRGKRLALLMNNTALTNEGNYLIEEMAFGWDTAVVKLLAMEHGCWGALQPGLHVQHHQDPVTGVAVASIYSDDVRRPALDLFDDVDAVVFCAQDVGIRHWTYTMHMGYCMELAATTGTEVLVLDLPNPLGGRVVEGAPHDLKRTSLIGAYPIPLRHGMTVGEIALYINGVCGIGCNLSVIPMEGWTRNLFGDETGLYWTAPSPNVPTMESMFGFAALGLLQSTSVSVGRGTTVPFSLFGAPWMDGRAVAAELNAMRLPGLHCLHKPYLPMFSLFAGEMCSGVLVLCDDREAARPVAADLRILNLLRSMYGDRFTFDSGETGNFDKRAGTDKLGQILRAGADMEPLMREWTEQAALFERARKPYLLYD